MAGVSTVALWKAAQRGELLRATVTNRGALYESSEIQKWKRLRKERSKTPRISTLEGARQMFDQWHLLEKKSSTAINLWGWSLDKQWRVRCLLKPMAELWNKLPADDPDEKRFPYLKESRDHFRNFFRSDGW